MNVITYPYANFSQQNGMQMTIRAVMPRDSKA